MLGLYYDGELRLRDDLPVPEPAPGEALVKVLAAGICNTDLEIVKGYMDFKGVLGHEFVGVVERAEVEDLVGTRVVGEINCACGCCQQCLENRPHHCIERTTLGISGRDGAFAEYLTLPVENLHVLPDYIPQYSAIFIEPLAACLRVLEQVHVHPYTRVAVLGDGKLGQIMAQVMRLTGCELLAVGKFPEKIKILDRMGIRTVTADEVDNTTFDVVIECTGKPEGYDLARRMVRPTGTIVQKSTYVNKIVMDISGLVVDEVSIVGSRCGSFEPAIRTLMRGLVDVQALIDRRFPLENGLQAFEYAAREDVLKVVLDMGTSPAEGLHGPGELEEEPVI
jgi:threonine dehydrogenase-like Zn-dependent dehydrogenase